MDQTELVMAATTSSTHARASARISSSVRSWMGWATNTAAGEKPRAALCAAAASTNSVDAMKTPGRPRPSRSVMSCTLHDVQLPQSASASITTSHCVAIWWRRSMGAGLVKVGFL